MITRIKLDKVMVEKSMTVKVFPGRGLLIAAFASVILPFLAIYEATSCEHPLSALATKFLVQ